MSRAWRPSYKSLYVISDIFGNARSLEVILNRILPLRIFKDQEDQIVFLGNYVDGIENGHEVLDMLINVKQQYNNRVIFLRGKHEEMMLRATLGGQIDFDLWCENNGRSTISGYVKRAGISTNPYTINQARLKDIIPKSHLQFLQETQRFHIAEDYCFFNSGIDPKKSVLENNCNNFLFDTTSNRYVKTSVRNKTAIEFIDNYVYVCSANPQATEPYIHPRYMMLGGTSPEQIIVLELNSMDMSACTSGKSRIYKYNYDVIE